MPLLEVLEEHNISAKHIEIGIGPINAAANRSLLDLKEKRVLFVGTCGKFGKQIDTNSPIDLVSSSICKWSPPSTRTGQSELIEGIENPIIFDNLSPISLQLPQKTVLCSPSVTIDPNLAPEEKDCVENMELYSVAQELKKAASLTIILGITNVVGKTGREEWRLNYMKAASCTANFIRGRLSLLND